MINLKRLSYILLSSVLSSCLNNDESSLLPTFYVKDVSSTAPALVSSKFESEQLDYIVSSYPVIYSAGLKNKNLSIYENLKDSFSKKYKTNGFPQAALFIRSDLMDNCSDDQKNIDLVYPFLNYVDSSINDLLKEGKKAIGYLNDYSSNENEKIENRFGFNLDTFKAMMDGNKLSFIENTDNPTTDEYEKFSKPLKLSFNSDDFSKTYRNNYNEYNKSFNFPKVTVPKGGPSFVFTKYAINDNLNIASPDIVSAQFTSKESDFIVFDSVNGIKLSKKNNDSYKICRLITFGNLYLVSTGFDEDKKISSDDIILSYGENLIPDLVYKSLYC